MVSIMGIPCVFSKVSAMVFTASIDRMMRASTGLAMVPPLMATERPPGRCQAVETVGVEDAQHAAHELVALGVAVQVHRGVGPADADRDLPALGLQRGHIGQEGGGRGLGRREDHVVRTAHRRHGKAHLHHQ